VRREEIDLVYRGGPNAVAAVIAAQAARIDALLARVEELERQLGRSSLNSSLPPSRDSPTAREERPKKKGSGRKQGGQRGHPGQHRPMVEHPNRVETYWPAECGGCGAAVGEADRVGDGEPVCHQVSDIRVVVEVCEHRRMRTRCTCGHRTLAPLPVGVPEGAFGASVAAAAATLTAARVSRRETGRLLEDLCGIQIGVASVEALVKQASAALEDPYEQILRHLDDAKVRCADETSWRQAGDSRWLSVAAAVDAALFQIAARRDRAAARALLGDDPGGVIVSDRYAVYLYIDAAKRQLCLAHVRRDFIALGERAGAPGRLGRKLQKCLADAFKILNATGRDLNDLTALQADLAPTRQRLLELLQQGARGRDPHTARFCRGLLDRYDALWTFTQIAGVPATNNTAERALRHGVMWRKTSYGTQTDDGNRTVERLLTIRETCSLQGRRLHTYLADALTAHQHGQPVLAPLRV
jgi:transposase